MSEQEAREQLRKAIVNENKRLRENLRTPTEEAITAEMGRHMEALSRTWEKLHTQLL